MPTPYFIYPNNSRRVTRQNIRKTNGASVLVADAFFGQNVPTVIGSALLTGINSNTATAKAVKQLSSIATGSNSNTVAAYCIRYGSTVVSGVGNSQAQAAIVKNATAVLSSSTSAVSTAVLVKQLAAIALASESTTVQRLVIKSLASVLQANASQQVTGISIKSASCVLTGLATDQVSSKAIKELACNAVATGSAVTSARLIKDIAGTIFSTGNVNVKSEIVKHVSSIITGSSYEEASGKIVNAEVLGAATLLGTENTAITMCIVKDISSSIAASSYIESKGKRVAALSSVLTASEITTCEAEVEVVIVTVTAVLSKQDRKVLLSNKDAAYTVTLKKDEFSVDTAVQQQLCNTLKLDRQINMEVIILSVVGDTVRLKASFKDFDGTAVSPDNVAVTIYDSRRRPIGQPVSVTPISVGEFQYDYTIPEGTRSLLYYEFAGTINGKAVIGRDTIELSWV